LFNSSTLSLQAEGFCIYVFSGKSKQLNKFMVVDCYSWPHHFLEKKKQVGLAPAAKRSG